VSDDYHEVDLDEFAKALDATGVATAPVVYQYS
jgi:hypothetical protein